MSRLRNIVRAMLGRIDTQHLYAMENRVTDLEDNVRALNRAVRKRPQAEKVSTGPRPHIRLSAFPHPTTGLRFWLVILPWDPALREVTYAERFNTSSAVRAVRRLNSAEGRVPLGTLVRRTGAKHRKGSQR